MTVLDRRDAVPGVNLVLLSNGSEIHLDDIATAAEGQAILDGLDGAILAIEDQLDRSDHVANPTWRRRAEGALKRKRRQRPALQQRIAALRKAERQASHPESDTSHKDARRKTFVKAAQEMLPPETFAELWNRAAEMAPSLFAADGSKPNGGLRNGS